MNHIIAQGSPNSLIRFFQEKPEVGVALFRACRALPDFNIDDPDAADFKDNAEAFMTAMRLAKKAIDEIPPLARTI